MKPTLLLLVLASAAVGQETKPQNYPLWHRLPQEKVEEYRNPPPGTKPIDAPEFVKRFQVGSVKRGTTLDPKSDTGFGFRPTVVQKLDMTDPLEFYYYSDLPLVVVGHEAGTQLKGWTKEQTPNFMVSYRRDVPEGPVAWQRVIVEFDLTAYVRDAKTQRTQIIYVGSGGKRHLPPAPSSRPGVPGPSQSATNPSRAASNPSSTASNPRRTEGRERRAEGNGRWTESGERRAEGGGRRADLDASGVRGGNSALARTPTPEAQICRL